MTNPSRLPALQLRTRRRTGAAALLLAALAGGCGGTPPPAAPVADPATARTVGEGPVVGFTAATGAHAWLGLPYAAPPVGELRWRAPRPPASWQAPRAALQHGNACLQIASPLGGAPADLTGQPWGSEDCLYLNVWAPADAPAGAATLPVMLWVHGGGNVAGHGGFQDGATLAARERVIVVSVNYRLGPFGWFRHAGLAGDGPLDASGNYGTLDLVQALHWVQANARAFGGDPGRVTVFGESAGGTNIFSLLLSPLADGLFHAAIIQSGGLGFDSVESAERPAAEGGHVNSSAEIVARMLIASGDAADRTAADARAAELGDAEIARRLRDTPTQSAYDWFRGAGSMLGPQVATVLQDGVVIRRGDPLALLADPDRRVDVPVLLGTNRDEPKIFMAFTPGLVTRVFGIPLWTRDATAYDRDARYGALAWKARGVDAPADALAASGAAVFAYRWDWDEEGTRFGFVDISHILGAAHGLEIPFVFGHFDLGASTALLFDDANEPARLALSEAMMGYWAGFAASGRPGDAAGRGPEWPQWPGPDGPAATLLLDTPADGGIRVMGERVDVASIAAHAGAEPLPQRERCALLARTFRFDPVDLDPYWPTLGDGGCGAWTVAELAAP